MGIVQEITTVISAQEHVNMKSISFDSLDGIFEGKILLYVSDTSQLSVVIENLKEIEGIRQIERVVMNDTSIQ
jgi:GTP pyrophosphokinase